MNRRDDIAERQQRKAVRRIKAAVWRSGYAAAVHDLRTGSESPCPYDEEPADT